MLRRFAAARVLVIDDNDANVALLRLLLTRAGIREVRTFTDPREALAHLGDIDPDLVLLDLHMPHVDGFQFLREVVQYAAGAYLPVLVLTADSTTDAAHKALNLGANDFVTKPFDASEVVLRVRNLLETRGLYETVRSQNRRLRDQLDVYHAMEKTERDSWQDEREKVEAVLNADGLRMNYQPIFDLVNDELIGVEALARFPDASMSPDQWFSAAERVGLGPALEIAALQRAVKILEVLPESTFVALNVSPGLLLTPEFHGLFDKEISQRLVLELTEHVPVEDYAVIAQALGPLRSSGVRLAADDTGAGYAGFNHLLGLDPDIIKLDISLIRDIHRDPVRRALATALVRFAADTNRTLVAEGIENSEEFAVVRDLSVHWGQGFHLGRPEPQDALQVALVRR